MRHGDDLVPLPARLLQSGPHQIDRSPSHLFVRSPRQATAEGPSRSHLVLNDPYLRSRAAGRARLHAHYRGLEIARASRQQAYDPPAQDLAKEVLRRKFQQAGLTRLRFLTVAAQGEYGRSSPPAMTQGQLVVTEYERQVRAVPTRP